MVYKRRISKRKSVRKNRKGSRRRGSRKMRGGEEVASCKTLRDSLQTQPYESLEELREDFGDLVSTCTITEEEVKSTAAAWDAQAAAKRKAEMFIQGQLAQKAAEDAREEKRFNSLSPEQQAAEKQLKYNEASHTAIQANVGRSFVHTGVLASGRGAGRGRGRAGGSRRRQRGGGRGHGR